MNNKEHHEWVCVSPGEYDFTYYCTKCGKFHTESIDNPDTELPVDGCKGKKEKDNE